MEAEQKNIKTELHELAKRSPFTVKIIAEAYNRVIATGLADPIAVIEALIKEVASAGGGVGAFKEALAGIESLARSGKPP